MPLLIGFMTGLLVGGLPNACQSRDTEREKTEVRREMEAMHGDALAREAASSVEAAKEKEDATMGRRCNPALLRDDGDAKP